MPGMRTSSVLGRSSPKDVLKAHFVLPEAKIVASHMDAVNHCLLSRDELRQCVADNQIAEAVSIPQVGKVWSFRSGVGDETHGSGDCGGGRV